jgi:hypothetical protein
MAAPWEATRPFRYGAGRFYATPSHLYTPCPTKALWSFNGTLNVFQANALPLLAPLLILRLALR